MLGSLAFWTMMVVGDPAGSYATPALNEQAASMFRYAGKARIRGFDENTLFMKTGVAKDGSIEVSVLKWTSKGGDNLRYDMAQRRTLTLDQWNSGEAPQSVSVSPTGDNFEIRVQHRVSDRMDLIADSTQAPMKFKISKEPQKKENLPPACPAPVVGVGAEIDDARKLLDRAAASSLNNSSLKSQEMHLALARKKQILDQLRTDFVWFERQMASLEQINVSGASAVAELLKRAEGRTEFQKDPARVERLFHSLTLYGEFRMNPAHRRLSHLFWASESIKNRLLLASAKRGVRNQFSKADDDFVDGENIENFTSGRVMGCVLARSQYSCWHDANLDSILDASSSSRSIDDILDFVAAYDSGLVKVESGQKPFITHYVSPAALKNHYPFWWVNGEKFRIFKNAKGRSTLPAVIRLDLDPSHSRALKNSAEGSDESLVNERHFEGGQQLWKTKA